MLITEMSDAQRAALEIYLEVDDDFNPPSFSQVSEKLVSKGLSGSKSTVQRWSKECDFESHLNRHVNALMLASKEDYDNLQKEAGAENLKKTLMTLEENSELLHGSHEVLKLHVQQIRKRAAENNRISKDDAKFVLQLYNVTSTREDRLHDRQAMLDGVDKMSKKDLLAQFAGTDVSIEELANDDANTIDVEIEDE